MRMRAIVILALLALALGGCVARNTISNYGNFIPSTTVVDQGKIAGDAVQQLVTMYLPARTALEMKQPTPDPFGQALVRALRDKGYSLLEFVPPKENTQGATEKQADAAASGKENAAAKQTDTAGTTGGQSVLAPPAETTAATGGQKGSIKTKASNAVTTDKGKGSKKKQHNRKRRGAPVEEAPVQPIVPLPPPQHLTLRYVLDQIDTDLYCLILIIGDQSISRVYLADGTPAGSWVRKEE